MSYKKLIPVIYLKESCAYADRALSRRLYDNGAVADPVTAAVRFSEQGADELMIIDMSETESGHEDAVSILRRITKSIDTPVLAGGNIRRTEDVKKYLYAGAKTALLSDAQESNMMMMKEVADRFGRSKLGLYYRGVEPDAVRMAKDNGLSVIFVSNEAEYTDISEDFAGIPAIIETSGDMKDVLASEGSYGVTGDCFTDCSFDFMRFKSELSREGFSLNKFESAIPFSEFKLNSDGLIPVVVQDYKTDEVLMLAYMNEEAFRQTIETGKMTYYSRSRKELWVKGATSGHYQYVRSIAADCDQDTLLAKVRQVGAACHTGNRSCFYRNLVETEYAQTNPLKVFNQVMNVIEDRKINPKEGSYTNYLFEKGIDKILKKCGEEAAEIIIAAKNPDPEEIKYEISDFLYHVMVLMSLKGVTWEDIVKELANR